MICPGNNSPEKIKSWAIVELDSVVEYTVNRLNLTCPRGYKAFFMLNLIEQEISTAHKNLNADFFLALKLSYVVFIMLINIKISTIVGILTFMSMINFMLHAFHIVMTLITLKFRSRSPKSSHLLRFSQRCTSPSLVTIWPLVQTRLEY